MLCRAAHPPCNAKHIERHELATGNHFAPIFRGAATSPQAHLLHQKRHQRWHRAPACFCPVREGEPMNEVMIGAAAGAAAAVPMTWAMEVMHRLLPDHERHPL